jgi:hypothetical protein
MAILQKNRLSLIALTGVGIASLCLLWLTRYHYENVSYGSRPALIRINRLTGRVNILTREGWSPLFLPKGELLQSLGETDRAWVVWQEGASSKGTSVWLFVSAHENLTECQSSLDETEKNLLQLFEKSKEAVGRPEKNVLTLNWPAIQVDYPRAGRDRMSETYYCTPDTVDPRPKN